MNYRLIHGDAIVALQSLPDQSVHCCITSPPYFGLRDYKVDGQIGLEKTPALYVRRLVEIFREVRRVLRDDGTCWVNLGDSYANNAKWGGRTFGKHAADLHGEAIGRAKKETGVAPKNLIGIPWRVAFALQDDGWCLRQDIIWSKPNPMPESVQDRCTKSHEYLFLLAKNERYYLDSAELQEPAATNDLRRPYGSLGMWDVDGRPIEQRRGAQPRDSWKGSEFHTGKTAEHQLGRASGNRNHKYTEAYEQSETEEHRTKAGLLKISDVAYPTRNKRSVWTVATQPYPEAHFATFPPELVRTPIRAGCPEGGLVLDPFTGSGTTGAVALECGRNFMGIELNLKYIELARKRLSQVAPMFVSEATA